MKAYVVMKHEGWVVFHPYPVWVTLEKTRALDYIAKRYKREQPKSITKYSIHAITLDKGDGQ